MNDAVLGLPTEQRTAVAEQRAWKKCRQHPQAFARDERGPIGHGQAAGDAGDDARELASLDVTLYRTLLRGTQLGIQHQRSLGWVHCRVLDV